MSQAGQVLHLYVEVRPVAEEEGKLLERGQLMLQCPDVLPCSQRSSARSSPTRSLDHSPVTQRHTGRGDQSLPRSESSSRHSVSFQLQEPDATGSPTHYHRQEVLCDGFSQLLQVISPGMMGSLGHTCSSDTEPYQGRVVISPSSTLSTTPTCDHKSCEVPEGSEKEKTSVVSFGYIEKSNVHNTDSRWELDKTFHRTEGQALPVHPWKRLSDPVWSRGQPERGDPYPNHSYASQTQTQTHSSRGWTHLQRAAQDAGARDAAHRAMEVFGSPELRQRFARHGQEIYSPTLPRHHQTPRCRSWGGSPILARSTLTLPSKAQPLEQGRTVCCGSMTGLPRTPAADHLCVHGGYSAHSVAPASKLCLRAPAQSQQRPRPVEESPRLSSKFHPPLPAGRPTDIQHQIPTGTFLSSNFSRTGCQTGGSCNHRVNSSCNATHSLQDRANSVSKVSIDRPYKSPRCSSRSGDAVSPTSGRKSVSPSLDAEVACKLAMEATKLSTVFAGRRTPSPTPSQAESRRSESPKTGGLSHPYPTLKGRQCPEPLQVEETNHKWRTDQTVPPNRQGSVSPLFHHTGLFTSTPPASPAAPHQAAASQSPAVDPWQEQSSSPSKDMSTLHHCPQPPQCKGHRKSPGVERRQYDDLSDGSSGKSPEHPRRIVSIQNPDVLSLSWTSRHQTGSVQHCKDFRQTSCRGNTPSQGDEEAEVVGVSVGQREEEVAAGTWSQSSSGVTGSIGDAPFPETSSQDTSCGSQLESSSTTRPSSRSQKIARAKWEFLFGAQREEGSCNTADTSPPTPLSPTPPSSHHRTPANQRRAQYREGQNLSHHRVQQVEVELVTPNVRGASPKTGIIRQTVKYSETDLDAVPLRCYRETDLDEVMRAEAEGAEEVEADSAFGSNRSILGNSSFSPSDVATKGRMGGGKECDMEDGGGDEEEEVEEGVVSWASVRMLGDKQRQRATQEGDEVYSLLLKGSLAMSCDSHGGLKSPISVDSPRRPSDSNLDSFSRHFENIMESHRAKGTSYSSLDSVDLLTSGSTSVFTFDLPTLTPEIQSQICDSAKQIIELSFAPLAHPDPAAAAATQTSRSEISLSASGAGPQRGSTDGSESRSWTRSDKDSWHHSNLKDGFRKASSAPSLHSSPRERVANRPAELLDPQADVTRRLALDSSDEALANGTKADLQAARRLAKRLYHLDGFRKSDVARHLSKNNEFSQKVAEEYLSNFNFSGQNIDQALRLFLRQFALMGETQERERVLAHFSRRYSQCNTESLDTQDSVHTLTCAVMLLNSDLHGNNVGKRMSCSQFISNLEGLNNGKDFPKDLLKTLYSSIKNEKLQWTIDEEELRKSMSQLADVRTDAASHTMKRLGSGGNLLVGVAQQADGELYKSGFLVRKVHADPDGKRTPRGKRGWKSFYAMLKGLVLYLQKDEYRAERELTEEDVKNAVSIHHSLAMRAADYSKRPNVFYLRTADWRVFLFQAPNTEQMQSWITRINVVAAMFSAPPFPAAIGSQKRFSRPLLPGSNTKLSQEEQVKSHENRFRAVSSELAELTASTPDRKVKGRELEEQKLRQEYLEFEKTRYGTYAMLLRAKLSSADEDLAAFESRLFDNGGLQRAHSSPSLPQDASTKEKTRGTKKSKSLKVMSSSSSATRGSSSTGEGQKKNNGNNPQAELQEQSSDQEEALSV